MKNAEHYSFGPDGTLWTRTTGGNRRPESVEEMEGYCRERRGAVHYPVFKTYIPRTQSPGEQVPLPAA